MPPVCEQHRIVAELDKQFTRLDAAVSALKRVQANLKRYRASVLKAACEGRLVPTEAELARAEGRDYERADQLLRSCRDRPATSSRFNARGGCLAVKLRPGNVHSAEGWEELLRSEIERQQ